MTDQLHGRDLDEAVAKALGTYMDSCDGDQEDSGEGRWVCDGCRNVYGPWWEDFPAHAKCHRYSTDTSRQAEMLAWFRSRPGYQGAMLDLDQRQVGVIAWLFVGNMDVNGMGATINEALCRLVLAVKEREAKT